LIATDAVNSAITGGATVTVQAGGGASRRDPPSSGPFIGPVGATGSIGNVQPVPYLPAVDRLFASVSEKQPGFLFALHHDDRPLSQLLDAIAASAV